MCPCSMIYDGENDAEYHGEKDLQSDPSNHEVNTDWVLRIYGGEGSSTANEAKAYEISKNKESSEYLRADMWEPGGQKVSL